MPARDLANLGLKAGYSLGEDGWGEDMTRNLLLLSVLAQGGVLSVVSATPGSPSDNDVYLFADDHPTEPNKIAVRDAGAWVLITPLEGWRVYDRGANVLLLFDGTTWGPFVPEFDPEPYYAPVVAVAGASTNLLASQVGQYLRFTASGAKTFTIRPNSVEALPANGEWSIRVAATGDLTLIAGSGVTINPPAGGTLVMSPGMSAMLKRVAADELDLVGQTVPA